MTNQFTRIIDMIIADLNETLHQNENKNPIVLLDQYLRQCEQETENVGKLVERQSRLKDEFRREHNEATELAEKRKYQADIALNAGETELYQFALREHQQYSERLLRLNASLAQVSEQLSGLGRKHEEMKQKVKDMQLRRMELMGRENITRANQRIGQVLEYNTYSGHSYSKFKDIENYLDRLEQKVKSSFFGSTIDERVAQLEREKDSQENTPLNLTKE